MPAYRQYGSEELINLVSIGDRQAFDELYLRYWEKLFAIAYNRLQQVSAAEDVVQDVFTSLWKNREAARIASVENYLATATKYAVFRQVKKIQQQKERVLLRPEPAENLVENALETKMLMDLVRKEVEKLPERCRLVFNYSREAGLSVKEIATRMGISPKTVENQLTRALGQLRVTFRSFLHFSLVLFFSFFL